LDKEALLLILLTLAVYCPAFTWGMPHATGPERVHAWGNDDASPLAAMAEMHDTFVEKPPFRNTAYPWFHYFLMGASCLPYLLLLRITGWFAHASSVYPFGFLDPVGALRQLSWIVRSWSMVLGVAAVVGAYYAAKHMWNRRAGFLAGLFTLLMYPMAYYAKVTNPDMPVMGWTGLGLATAALILRYGATVRRGAWLATFIAVAVATKDQSAASFALVVPAMLWHHLRHGVPDRIGRWKSIWAAPVATAAVCLIVYVFASGIPVDPGRYRDYVGKVPTAIERDLYLRYPLTAAGLAAQVREMSSYLVDVMSWPLLLTSFAGILLCLRRGARLPLILALSALGFFALLAPVGFSRIHYLLAVAFPLNFFAGHALDRAMSVGRGWRWAAAAATAAMAGFLLLETADLTHDMIYDSRYAAAEWLDRYTRPGDRVMHFGFSAKLPALRADVGQIRIRRQSEAIDAIRESRPEVVLVIPQDITENRQRVEWRDGLNSVIAPLYADVFERLVDESLGYRLVARFQTPRLLPWLDRPFLSYPSVNPPVQIFLRSDRAAGMARLEPWREALYYPRFVRVRELTVEHLQTTAKAKAGL
jgi:hypothetical protein